MKTGTNSLLRMLFSIAIIALLNADVALSLAQQSAPPPPPPPPATPYKTVGKADVFYFAGQNATVVNVSNMNVWGANKNSLSLNAEFKVSGRKITAPQSVSLSFNSISKEKRFSSNEKLRVRAGEKQLQFDQRQEARPYPGGNLVMEHVEFVLPYSSFLELISADSITMSVGGVEFTLPGKHIEALRDLRRSIEP